MPTLPALERAIAYAGSLAALAALIKRPATTLQYWRAQGRIPRAEDAIAIAHATGIPKAALAPNIFGRQPNFR